MEDQTENIILEAEQESNEQESNESNSIDVITEPEIIVPKLVFIVPYRDREQQQQFFASHMKTILEDMPKTDYKIYYLHQKDERNFNRGAMRNIGFLAMKEKYPNDYHNITFVFNDVDTMPFTKNFLNYDTNFGNVKHFYGFTFALGGIVSIKGADFEKTKGYPNFWAWGYEDNLLQTRVQDAKLIIDRSQYYPIMDKNMFQMKDGLERIVKRSEYDRFMSDTDEGFSSIKNIEYNINEDTGFIDVSNFTTAIQDNSEENTVHDLRNGSKPFKQETMQLTGRRRRRPTMGMAL
jgi:hypothetical protein